MNLVYAKKNYNKCWGQGKKLRITLLGLAMLNKRIKEKLRMTLFTTSIFHSFIKSPENLLI